MSAIIVARPGYPHAQAFMEVAESFNACLAELWVDPTIVFGAHTASLADIQTETIPLLNFGEEPIIFNTEVAGSSWFSPIYLATLREHRVFDYSLQNIEWLKTQGIEAEYCPIGWHKCLERIKPAEQDIDVLFYGSIFGRRIPILDSILDTGLRCKWLFNVYGAERDAYIARSKVVLNLHAYENSPFEIIRCSYLWANSKWVVSEGLAGEWEGVADFEHASHLPAACEFAVAHVGANDGERARHWFRKRPQVEYLRRLLC